jgi:hypothetical protein
LAYIYTYLLTKYRYIGIFADTTTKLQEIPHKIIVYVCDMRYFRGLTFPFLEKSRVIEWVGGSLSMGRELDGEKMGRRYLEHERGAIRRE